MTKAERIVQLYATGLSVKEIAEIVGCLPEYVRVVARQRKGTSQSEIDRRYYHSPLGKVKREARIRRYREKRRAGDGGGEASP